MWVCQESEKETYTSLCYYLLLDNLNIWIERCFQGSIKNSNHNSHLNAKYLKHVLHSIYIYRKKDAFITGKVDSNINNLISPDAKNVCFAGVYEVAFPIFP